MWWEKKPVYSVYAAAFNVALFTSTDLDLANNAARELANSMLGDNLFERPAKNGMVRFSMGVDNGLVVFVEQLVMNDDSFLKEMTEALHYAYKE